jgi:hypothetical protein
MKESKAERVPTPVGRRAFDLKSAALERLPLTQRATA